jgi:Putative zinc-finger
MCNFSEKLIAWLDHELPENEARDVERHAKDCAECRSSVHAYEEAGNLFDAYCEAVVAAKANGKHSLWTPVLAGAAVTAAGAGLLLVFLAVLSKQTIPIERLPVRSAAVVAPPAGIAKTPIAPANRSQQRRASPQEHNSARAVGQNPRRNPDQNLEQDGDANWMAAGQNIQIAIPGDAVFPPGVVPEGVNFIADLSIAADGSAERLHLRP